MSSPLTLSLVLFVAVVLVGMRLFPGRFDETHPYFEPMCIAIATASFFVIQSTGRIHVQYR